MNGHTYAHNFQKPMTIFKDSKAPMGFIYSLKLPHSANQQSSNYVNKLQFSFRKRQFKKSDHRSLYLNKTTGRATKSEIRMFIADSKRPRQIHWTNFTPVC